MAINKLWERCFQGIHLSYFSFTFCSLNFSIYQWILQEAIITMVVQWCFFYFLHSFYIYYLGFFCKEYLSISPFIHLLNDLFISSFHGLLYYYLCYNPILSLSILFLCWPWKLICLFDRPLFWGGGTSLISGTSRCSRIILYFLDSRINYFSKEPWFLSSMNGFYKQRFGHQLCLLLLACHCF